MKNRRPAAIGAIFLPILLITNALNAQISVASTTGYAVNIVVLPTSVLPSTNNCPWGYNYNLRIAYFVTFTGSNIPASLYTLQGNIRCGSTNHFFDLPNNGGVGTVNSTSNQWNGASTCNTATVNSLNCNTARIEIEGIGISARTVTFPITFTALPVSLAGFSAVVAGTKVKLEWQTASEANSDYLSIERSTDGSTWLEQAKVNAAGHSDSLHSYSWYDPAPLPGASFYRIKMVDLDGRSGVSEVRVIQYSPGKNKIALYPIPNPGNKLTITGIDSYTHKQLTVINSSGVTVITLSLNTASVEMPAMKPGLYIVSIKDRVSGEVQNLRFVKL